MTYLQERVDIETRLSVAWNTTGIDFDNIKFIPTPGTAWIRCTILPGPVSALSFGRDTEKEFLGIIDIGIFVQKGTGTKIIRGYADTLSALFDMEEFGTVDCDEATVRNLGEHDDWLQFNITIPYVRRE